MLSAAKVKLHGLQDSRWTVTDKLSQYKGMINLFTRDRKVLQFDKCINRKKQKLQLKKIQRDVARSKKELDNAVKGDQQNIRNSLAGEKALQLAFQGLSPTDVVENIHQYNFSKRKELDRLKFIMKLRKQKLVDTKMELSLIEDREIYKKYFDKCPIERHAEIITGKVQDATLRKEAALAVHYTYARILEILKKDSYYFDAVLNALSVDLFNQGKCMYCTTELGQLATEYLDDRKEELKLLEQAIKSDMEDRRYSLKVVRSQVKKLAKNLRSLIRRESDIKVSNKPMEKTESDESLIDNIKILETMLRELQSETMVPDFEAIFPCLYGQKFQQDRLQEFINKLANSRDHLLHKRNYAEVKLDALYFTMVDSTFEYMEQKKVFKAKIHEKISEYEDTKRAVLKKGELMVKIRSSLQQLHMILKPLGYGSDKRVTIFYKDKKEDEEDFDGAELVTLLVQKLHNLASLCGPSLYPDEQSKEEAHYMFQDLVLKGCRTVKVTEAAIPDNLLEGLILEDTTILNRSDIKAQSKNIVQQYLNMAIELPPPQPKKRRCFR